MEPIRESHSSYLNNPAISASKIKAFLKSPAHYKAEYIDGKKKPESDAMMFGRMVHSAILEPADFRKRMIVQPKFSGTGSRKEKADWLAMAPKDSIIVTEDELEIITGMLNACRENHMITKLLSKGIPEVSLYFTHETGMPCKVRPDFLTEDGWIVDLKTTIDASKKGFVKQIWNYGYYMSAAFYLMAYKEFFGRPAEGYVFVAVEKEYPYLASGYVANLKAIELGEERINYALTKMKHCLEKAFFPGYQSEFEDMGPPPKWLEYEFS